MKFIALILSFVLGFFTYPLSFLEDNLDSVFEVATGEVLTINGEKTDVTVDGDMAADGTVTLNSKVTLDFEDTPVDWFNYFALTYTTSAYVKGEITYKAGVVTKTETFFLEPAQSGTFSSFIDNCFGKTKANVVCSVSFESLNVKTATIRVEGLATFNREVPAEEVFIADGTYKLGVNLVWGGAVSYLEDLDSDVEAVRTEDRVYVDSNASERYGTEAFSDSVNLINCFDPGRLIQQSYYGTMDYDCGEFMGNQWSYNPVQGGNQFGDSSKIVDIRCESDSIYIKSRPLDWAKEKEYITPSYMEAWYTIENGAVHIECRFVDFSGYSERMASQELPAFYCIEPFNNFVYYAGDNPWTGEPLSNEPDLIFWPDAGYPNFVSSECWAAFTGEFADSFGIGVYVPGKDTFLAGVFDRGGNLGDNPAAAAPTSYFAVVENRVMKSYEPFEYDYYVATGSTAEIRNTFSLIK